MRRQITGVHAACITSEGARALQIISRMLILPKDASLLSAYVQNLTGLIPITLASADVNRGGSADLLDISAICRAALGE